MQNLPFFDINHVFFTVWQYKMSYLEFWGTLLNIAAVYLSAKEKILSWPIGMVSVFLFVFLFYQFGLYPDMFLQGFFFITNAMGWYQWTHPKAGFENENAHLKITKVAPFTLLVLLLAGAAGTIVMGTFAKNLNEIFPRLFAGPSAFPYLDSFTTVLSILTTFLMIRKKVESWWLWLLIDIVSTYIYWAKDIKFLSLTYFGYCFIALFGAIAWTKKYQQAKAMD
jgi:nicotinamide mononucleotide transporter